MATVTFNPAARPVRSPMRVLRLAWLSGFALWLATFPFTLILAGLLTCVLLVRMCHQTAIRVLATSTLARGR